MMMWSNYKYAIMYILHMFSNILLFLYLIERHVLLIYLTLLQDLDMILIHSLLFWHAYIDIYMLHEWVKTCWRMFATFTSIMFIINFKNHSIIFWLNYNPRNISMWTLPNFWEIKLWLSRLWGLHLSFYYYVGNAMFKIIVCNYCLKMTKKIIIKLVNFNVSL